MRVRHRRRNWRSGRTDSPHFHGWNEGKEPMRRLLALAAVMILVQVTVSGCRHVAGACDCDHAPAAGAPAYINAQMGLGSAPVATIPAPGTPVPSATISGGGPAPLPK